jgi:Zn finger protein HypA/HybF involved in hydrogenase expression
MDIIHYIVSFFSSPKIRKISIVLLLMSGLIIAIVRNCSVPVLYDSPKIMICDNCGYRQQLRLSEKLKCPKCRRDMGTLWKCMTCSFEFEYRPVKLKSSYDSEEAFRRAKINSCKCPNCESEETFLVTVRNMPEKNPETAK